MNDLKAVLEKIDSSKVRLKEFFTEPSIFEIEKWAFEYASQVSDKMKFGIHDPKRLYVSAYILHDTLQQYEDMFNDEFNKNPRSIRFCRAILPSYSEIPKMVQEFIKKRGKDVNWI